MLNEITYWLKRYILIINIAVLSNLVSCASLSYYLLPIRDAELEPYFKIFAQEAKKRGYDLDLSEVRAHIVYFPNTSDDGFYTIGMSYDGGFYSHPYIVFLPKAWYSMGKVERELLFGHEMGHTLGADHNSGYIKKGNERINTSIMAPTLIDYHMFKANRDYYYDELFAKEVDKSLILKKFVKKSAE